MQDMDKPVNVQPAKTQASVAKPKKTVKINIQAQKPDLFVTLLSIIIAFIIIGFIVQLSWNESMPYIFGLRPLDFWTAICLYILTSVLFK